MLRPAVRPIVLALSSCSTRRRVPSAGFAKLATSPAAYTSGWLVRQNWSTTTPLSTPTPACSASSTAGTLPRPPTRAAAPRPPPPTRPAGAGGGGRGGCARGGGKRLVGAGRGGRRRGAPAGGGEQLAEAVFRALVARRLMRRQIEPADPAAQVELRAGGRGLAPDLLLGLTLPQGFRERRPVVPGMRLRGAPAPRSPRIRFAGWPRRCGLR